MGLFEVLDLKVQVLNLEPPPKKLKQKYVLNSDELLLQML